MIDALAEIQQRVSATTYQVLHLRWLEGRSVVEVAARLDLTPQQVWYRQHRAKQKFRELLEIRVALGGTAD